MLNAQALELDICRAVYLHFLSVSHLHLRNTDKAYIAHMIILPLKIILLFDFLKSAVNLFLQLCWL